LLRQPVRWQRLFALADHHGIHPLLYQALLHHEEVIPRDQMQFLRQTGQATVQKALLLSRELIRIVEHLAARSIELMPYKGPALAELLYADIAMRQSGDIDLLVRPRDFARVRDAVRELGYSPHQQFSAWEERAYLKSGYECAFDGPAGPNLLELQWAILPRFYAVDFDMDELFQRAVSLAVAGQRMLTPSPSDYFLLLSLHAAKHVWGRLVWLCDVARLMTMSNLDWEWIGERGRSLGVARILRLTMLTARQMLDAAIPDAAARALGEDVAEAALVNQVESSIVSETAFNVESLAYFRLMMRLRERRSDRLRFLARLVFTPGPSEWAAVRLPSSLFPLYRLVRLSRLAARLVRA
jgi:hypothetical protein